MELIIKYALNAYSAFNKKPRVTISRNTKLALIALNLFLPKFFEIVEKVNKNLKMVFKIKFYILNCQFKSDKLLMNH